MGDFHLVEKLHKNAWIDDYLAGFLLKDWASIHSYAGLAK